MVLVAFLLAGCSQDGGEAERGQVSEYAAILASLEASRNEVRQLRGDIAELRQEVNGLRAGGVAAPAAAAEPTPTVAEVSLTKSSPVIGASDAKLAIIEFTDYQCPFCGRFNDNVLPQLVENYVKTGAVKIIARDYPLDFHANARPAALAANCAAQQGAYEPMRAGLFAAQQNLGPDLYQQIAEANGLDITRFNDCVNEPKNEQHISEDISYANTLGVSGTPSFFIGRIEGDKLVDVTALVGALPYESFSTVITDLSGD
jgi:protein-disulfide isomerase